MDEAVVTRHSPQMERFDRTRLEAISGAQPRRPIVMILGMHRTGTSLCSHILSMLGVDMADEIRPGVGNDHGHWERWELVAYHDRILELFDRGYASTLHDLPLPVAWWADPAVATIRREMSTFLDQRMGRGNFGFKDPRTVRLMPLWHQICDELKLTPKIILCVRDPAQVARSLQARDGLDRGAGEYRWLVHMVDFFRYAGGAEYCLIEYEKWFDNPRANVQRLRKFLGLQWQQSEADLDLVLANLIDPKVRHDDLGHGEPDLALARSLYQFVRHADQDPDARAGIDEIVAQFVAVQQTQAPLQRALEIAHAEAAKLPEYEKQLAVSQALIAERDLTIAEIEEQRSRVGEVEREGAERLTALTVERAEIEALRATLAQIEHEREQGTTELARADDEITALRATLAENESALTATRSHMAEREAVLADALATIDAEHGKLAQIMREHKLGIAELARAEDEAAALRATLVESERERTEGSTKLRLAMNDIATLRQTLDADAAAAKALEAEAATLREQVVAARQVGRELLAALQVSAATKSPPPPRVAKRSWWRRSFMRPPAATRTT